MTALYPFKFKTIFKEKIWGGDKIKAFLGKDFSPLANCGETWELSAVPQEVSEVANGPLAGQNLQHLIETHRDALLGKSVYEKFGNQFPLLIKFIDANADLSVQVHPDDTMAQKLHGKQAFGKSEMWYVLHADEGASLISGFKEKVDKQEFRKRLKNSTIESVLNREEVEAGDVFYVPAGRIHTIGKGLLVAEVQQTSDITYRIYDFDRKDAEGNKRELHVNQAAEALDFTLHDSYKTAYSVEANNRSKILNTPFFTVNKWLVNKPRAIDYKSLDSFVILIGLKGKAEIEYSSKENFTLKKGEVYLVPASIDKLNIDVSEDCEFLEVYIQ